MSLKTAVDAAYPFDYSTLPDDCEAILGYVGGKTPHVWTPDEITTAELHAEWWAIWTMPERALTTDDGENAASGMVTKLKELRYEPGKPVFLDIERSAWDTNLQSANAAANTWQMAMRLAGYKNAYAYGREWLARWTGEQPTILPTGAIGWQYASDRMLNKPYDISIFDPKLWNYLHTPVPDKTTENDTMYIFAYPGSDVRLVVSGGRGFIANQPFTTNNMTRTGIPTIVVDHRDFDEMVDRFVHNKTT